MSSADGKIEFLLQHCPVFSVEYLGKGKCHNPKVSNKSMYSLETLPLKKCGTVDCQEKIQHPSLSEDCFILSCRKRACQKLFCIHFTMKTNLHVFHLPHLPEKMN